MDLTGRTLSRYEILERIGAGGMGVVYRAHDRRLEREVALKVLPQGALADETSRKQFRREALALSRLNHANIATVYDFDEEDGLLFLAMELVEGTSLLERLGGGGLPEETVRSLGAQLADGLAAAHQRGVLHRDIKPGNLRVTPGGVLKVLDFGLAKVTRSVNEIARTETLSATEGAAGTVPYMAPEQVRSERPTEATDIYGAGAVLYEMATGRRAFPQGGVGEVVGAILSETPVRPRALAPAISTELEELILNALAKDPASRPASATDLARALRDREAVLPIRRRIRAPRLRAPRGLAWAGLAILAIAPFLWILNPGGFRDTWTGAFGVGPKSVAVLPFANMSADSSQDYLVEGITDGVITRLTQISSLKVISRTSSVAYKGTRKPVPQIARELGVQMVVQGRVQHDGSRVRVSAQLIRARSGQQVWSGSFERGVSEAAFLESNLAQSIAEKMRIRIDAGERRRVTEVPAVNAQAHEAFLKAEAQAHMGTAQGAAVSARDLYREAVLADPTYADAYAGLAYSYLMLSSGLLPATEAMPRAKSAALMALSLDSTQARARAVLAYVRAFYDWDWQGAGRDFQAALALCPGSAEVRQNYAFFLLVNGRFAESSAQFKRARELDPLSGWIAFMSLWPIYNSRHYDEAIRESRTLIQSDPTQIIAYHIIGQASLMKRDYPEALKAYDELERAKLPFALIDCWHVYALALAGERARAHTILDQLLQTQRSAFVPAYGLAIAYAGLGEKDEVFRWLDRAFQDRSEDMVNLKVEPAWDGLRSDPRFKAILRRMGFATPGAQATPHHAAASLHPPKARQVSWPPTPRSRELKYPAGV